MAKIQEALDSFKFLEQTLENSQKTLTTPVILAGPYFSFFWRWPGTKPSATGGATNIRRMMIAD